jgi:general secretion pathway protein L
VPSFLPDTFKAAVSESGAVAAVVPEQSVLCRSLTLPLEAEVELPQVVSFEVAAHTPFPHDETVAGWQVIERASDQLQVLIAMTARQAVESALDYAAASSGSARSEAEAWAETEHGLVMLPGFGEAVRQRQYLRALGVLAGQAGLICAAVVAVLLVPLIWLSISSAQLDTQLTETQQRAVNVTTIRDALSDLEASVAIAEDFFEDRPLYDEWLNHLAYVTPDSVFLQRLQLQSSQLTITGLAENAADYQTILASSGEFSALQAPTAFTRDTRQNRERFVLVMQLAGSEL